MTRGTFAIALAIITATLAPAGEYNEKLKIGDAAPAWSKLARRRW